MSNVPPSIIIDDKKFREYFPNDFSSFISFWITQLQQPSFITDS